jgi:hypothetical protein
MEDSWIDNVWKSLIQLPEANPARLARAGVWASMLEITLNEEEVEIGLYHALRRKGTRVELCRPAISHNFLEFFRTL